MHLWVILISSFLYCRSWPQQTSWACWAGRFAAPFIGEWAARFAAPFIREQSSLGFVPSQRQRRFFSCSGEGEDRFQQQGCIPPRKAGSKLIIRCCSQFDQYLSPIHLKQQGHDILMLPLGVFSLSLSIGIYDHFNSSYFALMGKVKPLKMLR